MNKIKFLLLFCAFFICIEGYSFAKSNTSFTSQKNFFIENKGQIKDQDGNPRNDIQYILQAPGISVFIGNGQLHYQFIRHEICPGATNNSGDSLESIIPNKISRVEALQTQDISTYRMDVELMGANPNAGMIAEEPQAYYENYCLTGCPEHGLQAHSNKRITYKNVYPGIDWVIYMNGDKLEHEFVVGPGGDPSLIKLKYSGQSSLKINGDGSITATTPMGVIKEHVPVCYMTGISSTKGINGTFLLHGNILSYKIDKYKGTLVIDPMVEWATYYGPDSSTSPVYAAACDPSANVYICGLTYADFSIATTGSYQYIFAGNTDAYLVKFDSSGNRLWATYYGGSQGDWGTGVSCDHSGNIYLTGSTASLTGIATVGAHQVTYGGGLWDGFLAKFNPSGMLQWATYYGGGGTEYPYSTSCDNMGHVYMSGFTSSSNNIGTTSGYRPVSDGGYETFLAQFDSAGNLQWGTYYGGPSSEFGGVCSANGNYVYLTAWTSSTTGISSPGCFQPVFGGGGGDAYVVKFDYSGNRLWATYYGGAGAETTGGIISGPSGYIYLVGTTGSETGIASPGSFQPAFGGGDADAFLVKLEPELGMRVWGTYYGGEQTENADLSRIITDDSDNVFITGYTSSLTGIASTGAWQADFGGGDFDAFFAKYNGSGIQQWSTYYGGNATDYGVACAFDGRNVYLSGKSNSIDNIATPDGLEPTGGGGEYYYEGFLAKFVYRDTGSTLSTGIPTVSGADLAIYPSPNNGAFCISGTIKTADGSGSAQIIITDLSGKTIWNDVGEIADGRIYKAIRLNNSLPGGTYLLKVVTNNNVNILRFVKE